MGTKSARVNFGFRPEELVDLGKAGKRCDVGQERIAVGRSGGDELSADGTGGARFCLDDDRLLDDRFKRRGERTHDDFRRPSGRKRIDDGDGPRGISVLREGHLAHAELQAQACCDERHGWTGHVSSRACLPDVDRA